MGSRRTTRLLAGFMVAAALSVAGAAPAGGWQCWIDDADVSGAAQPRISGTEVLLNIARLAQHLNWQVRTSGRSLELIDAGGNKWTGSETDPALVGRTGSVSTAPALVIEGASAYLPSAAIGQISGLSVTIDSSKRQVRLYRRPAAVISTVLPDGWETFTLDKTAEEKVASGVMDAAGGTAPVKVQRATTPPPSADALRIDVSQGYLVRGDAGTELSSSGKVNGFSLSSNTLLTVGAQGLVPLNGKVVLAGRRDDWWLTGGDMFSEIWGLARGVRYSKELGKGHRPALSLYLRSRRDGQDQPAFSLMDEVTLAHRLTVGGEANSDSSYFGKASLQVADLSMHGFYRNARIEEGKSHGASVAYSLFHRISIQGRLTRSGAGFNRIDLRNGSMRFGLPLGTDLTLDYTDLISPGNRQRVAAGMLGVPAGPVRLRLRYQARDQILQAAPGFNMGALRSLQHEAFTTATYYSNRKLSLDYQMSQRWRRDGSLEMWNQVIGTFRLDKRTDLQAVFGIPDVTNPNQMRLRFARWVREDTSISLEYGNVSNYQGTPFPVGDRAFRIGFRKIFNVRSPAHGGRLSGRVVDGLDQPFEGVVVRLGPYSAATDKSGGYTFRNVPPGPYQVKVDEQTLPANYIAQSGTLNWLSTGRSRDTVDLAVTALGSLQGRVYIDGNGNGQFDPGEGIEKIPIMVDERVTASQPDGSFGFYNLKPGVYKVRLMRDRIPQQYEPAGALEAEVKLSPTEAPDSVQFQLKRRIKDVLFQDLR